MRIYPFFLAATKLVERYRGRAAVLEAAAGKEAAYSAKVLRRYADVLQLASGDATPAGRRWAAHGKKLADVRMPMYELRHLSDRELLIARRRLTLTSNQAGLAELERLVRHRGR